MTFGIYWPEPILDEIRSVDVNARDAEQKTPLHYAAMLSKNPEVIEILLSRKANPNAQDSEKSTPLHEAAIENENPEITRILASAPNANVDARNSDENTPLIEAARRNSSLGATTTIQHLVNAGADINAEGDQKRTPLLAAALYNSNPKVVDLLLELGADSKAEDALGHTYDILLKMKAETHQILGKR